MVPGIVQRKVMVEVPGTRTHVGWNAEDVAAVQEALGIDWGVVVRPSDGPLQLRESRMTAILWAYVRIKLAGLS